MLRVLTWIIPVQQWNKEAIALYYVFNFSERLRRIRRYNFTFEALSDKSMLLKDPVSFPSNSQSWTNWPQTNQFSYYHEKCEAFKYFPITKINCNFIVRARNTAWTSFQAFSPIFFVELTCSYGRLKIKITFIDADGNTKRTVRAYS